MSTLQILQVDMAELMAAINEAVKVALSESEKPHPNIAPEDKIYTPEQAAELLEASKSTITNWRNDGLLGSWKLGGRIYIKRSDIDEALVRIKLKKSKL